MLIGSLWLNRYSFILHCIPTNLSENKFHLNISDDRCKSESSIFNKN